MPETGARMAPDNQPNGPELENPHSKKRKFSRRQILAAAGLGAAGLMVGDYEIEKDWQDKEVDRIGDVLRRDSDKAVLEIGLDKMTHKEFVDLMTGLIGRKDVSHHAVEKLLEGYSDMIEVEQEFGAGMNSWPMLERVEPFVAGVSGGHVETANSFGYGQVNPETAREIALEHAEQLLQAKLLIPEQIRQLQDHKTSRQEVVKILKLRDDENVIYGFLVFFDAYKHYGTDSAGKIHPDHLSDPRAFGLAVAAYSAKTESPRGAKVQTYLNEMLLADQALRSKVAEKLGWKDQHLLNVDGDLGSESLAIMGAMADIPEIAVPLPPELVVKPPALLDLRMEAMHAWLKQTQKQWRGRAQFFIDQQRKRPADGPRGDLAQFICRRYTTAVRSYSALLDQLGGPEWAKAKRQNQNPPKNSEQIKLDKVFTDFLENRAPAFNRLIASQQEFTKHFSGADYQKFIGGVLGTAQIAIDYDERYAGYVPTAYAGGRVPLVSNPKNIFQRVVMSHDLHPGDPAAIGLYAPRRHRQEMHAALMKKRQGPMVASM